jgi:hypothetical protein
MRECIYLQIGEFVGEIASYYRLKNGGKMHLFIDGTMYLFKELDGNVSFYKWQNDGGIHLFYRWERVWRMYLFIDGRILGRCIYLLIEECSEMHVFIDDRT